MRRAVYKASWRQAPVAVKYIVCCTEDHDSLGRAIREVVLSKKMSHPNVVRVQSCMPCSTLLILGGCTHPATACTPVPRLLPEALSHMVCAGPVLLLDCPHRA